MVEVEFQEGVGAVSGGTETAVDSRQSRICGRIVGGRLLSSGRQVVELLRMLPVEGRVMMVGEITETAFRVLFLRKENEGGQEYYVVDIYMRCNGRCGGRYRRGQYRMSFEEAVNCVWHFVSRHRILEYELINLEGVETC